MEIRQTAIVPGQPESVPPVYFQSLSLKNVKCFKQNTTLDFTTEGGKIARWTVILGENGAGKTTVLQTLAGLAVRPSSIKKEGVDHPVVSQNMSDVSWFEWHQGCQRQNDNREHTYSSKISIGSTLEGAARSKPAILPWDFSVKIVPGHPSISLTITGPAAEPKMLAGLICYGYGAGRRMARTARVPKPQNPPDSIHTLFSEDSTLPNAGEWLLELDHAAKIEHPHKKNASEQFDTVRNMLLHVLPNVSDMRVAIGSRGSEPNVHIEYKTPYAWVKADQLSFGYQTIIAWVVDLTRRLFIRYPNSKNAIEQPAIVLIDELDLHLHPKWQRGIMEYLTERFTNTQFIVTAHSPLIVQSNPDANIILLERDGDHIQCNQDLDMVKNWRIDQILTSDLFQLDSARPPRQGVAVEERSILLAKPILTKSEKARLKVLNKIIHAVPTGETDLEREAEEIIKKAAESLRR